MIFQKAAIDVIDLKFSVCVYSSETTNDPVSDSFVWGVFTIILYSSFGNETTDLGLVTLVAVGVW